MAPTRTWRRVPSDITKASAIGRQERALRHLRWTALGVRKPCRGGGSRHSSRARSPSQPDRLRCSEKEMSGQYWPRRMEESFTPTTPRPSPGSPWGQAPHSPSQPLAAVGDGRWGQARRGHPPWGQARRGQLPRVSRHAAPKGTGTSLGQCLSPFDPLKRIGSAIGSSRPGPTLRTHDQGLEDTRRQPSKGWTGHRAAHAHRVHAGHVRRGRAGSVLPTNEYGVMSVTLSAHSDDAKRRFVVRAVRTPSDDTFVRNGDLIRHICRQYPLPAHLQHRQGQFVALFLAHWHVSGYPTDRR